MNLPSSEPSPANIDPSFAQHTGGNYGTEAEAERWMNFSLRAMESAERLASPPEAIITAHRMGWTLRRDALGNSGFTDETFALAQSPAKTSSRVRQQLMGQASDALVLALEKPEATDRLSKAGYYFLRELAWERLSGRQGEPNPASHQMARLLGRYGCSTSLIDDNVYSAELNSRITRRLKLVASDPANDEVVGRYMIERAVARDEAIHTRHFGEIFRHAKDDILAALKGPMFRQFGVDDFTLAMAARRVEEADLAAPDNLLISEAGHNGRLTYAGDFMQGTHKVHIYFTKDSQGRLHAAPDTRLTTTHELLHAASTQSIEARDGHIDPKRVGLRQASTRFGTEANEAFTELFARLIADRRLTYTGHDYDPYVKVAEFMMRRQPDQFSVLLRSYLGNLDPDFSHAFRTFYRHLNRYPSR